MLSAPARTIPALLVLATLLLQTPAAAQRPAAGPTLAPQELARIWDAEQVSPPVSALVDHGEVVKRLNALPDDLFTVEQVGESVEGRSIHHVRAGRGAMPVLLWSQMHGDEPTATSALFDVFAYLERHRETPLARGILNRLTLHVIPMLNPDGAERFQRRNAQGIDINRDALRLQTPEGRILKDLRDRLRPQVGFNLHNQNWRTSVGDPPRPASMSLLSVAFDEKRSNSPGRRLTRRLGAVVRDAIEPFASGQIGRYTDEFEVRAFGDNITLWGTPVLLIETGPWPSAQQDPALVRLNFVALMTALDALATGSVERADPRRYDSLPLNESRLFYILVRNATVINGAGLAPYTADIGINASRRVRVNDGRREVQIATSIDDLGDLRANAGLLRTIDASGMFAVPDTGYEEGALVDLPEWRTRLDATLALGQPGRLALLRPEAGRYRVEIVLR
jgi:hypothetical protein